MNLTGDIAAFSDDEPALFQSDVNFVDEDDLLVHGTVVAIDGHRDGRILVAEPVPDDREIVYYTLLLGDLTVE